MVSIVLVQWRVGAIEENGYGIQGQNYVAFPQGSEMTAEFLFYLVKVSLKYQKLIFTLVFSSNFI